MASPVPGGMPNIPLHDDSATGPSSSAAPISSPPIESKQTDPSATPESHLLSPQRRECMSLRASVFVFVVHFEREGAPGSGGEDPAGWDNRGGGRNTVALRIMPSLCRMKARRLDHLATNSCALRRHTRPHTPWALARGRKMSIPQEVQCAAARPVPQRRAQAGEAAWRLRPPEWQSGVSVLAGLMARPAPPRALLRPNTLLQTPRRGSDLAITALIQVVIPLAALAQSASAATPCTIGTGKTCKDFQRSLQVCARCVDCPGTVKVSRPGDFSCRRPAKTVSSASHVVHVVS